MFIRRLLCVAAFLFCLLPLSSSAQFAHTQQKQIVDASGKPFLIHGTNLGNWFIPEGYMWDFEGGPQSAREIEALVTELIGPDKAKTFWHQYRDRYIAREDIHLLHEAGLNTIRIPLHYKFFETDDSQGFALLDRVVQ